MSDTMKHIDLFCGAGGASCGAEMAGWNTVCGVDQDEQALKTYNENLQSEPIKHDLADVDVSRCSGTDVAWVHGSPPCKGFSTANDERDISDERNNLVFHFLNWVTEIQPPFVTMENVTGMTSITDHFMDKVEGGFRDAGYQVKWRILNAADYGVPQTRRRVITMGVRNDLPTPSPWFPDPTHAETPTQTLTGETLEEWVTVQEAIGDLPPAGDVEAHTAQGVTSSARASTGAEASHSIGAESSNYIQINHVAPDHDDDVMERLAEVDHGENEHPAYHRPNPDEPSDVLVAGHMSQPIHYRTLIGHEDETTEWQQKRAGEGGAFDPRVPDEDEPAPTLKSGGGNDGRGTANVLMAPYNHNPRDSTDEEPMGWESKEPSETLSADARLPDKKRPPGDKSSRWEGARRLTVRECARLQSFPDWFVFTGTKTDQYSQVGNAVPPLLQYHIASHIQDLAKQILD